MAKQTQALVIGGSIAGMLAARVLSERFDKVIILERDTLPENAEHRSGVPQGNQLHVLLAKGQESIEQLLPGITAELNQTGAPSFHWGLDGLVVSSGGEWEHFDAGITTNLTSRVGLEYLIRKRVQAIPNVECKQAVDVTDLVIDNNSVTGLVISHKRTHQSETLSGDLVVDCSGRGSKLPEWLAKHSYEKPSETLVNAFVGYATRWYELPENYNRKFISIAIQANPSKEYFRAGGMFIVEDNRAVVTLQGVNKDYPPTEEGAFFNFAQSLDAPYLADFIKIAKPISPIYGYQRTENRIRHYEKISHRPENLLVMGDAYCGFNPVYGQGMSIAALEALMLQKLLKERSITHLEGFAGVFQKRIHEIVMSSWVMATAEDMRYPGTESDPPTLLVRIMQHYSAWMSDTAPHDAVIAKAFVDMMNMKITGIGLLHPSVFARVIWHKFIQPKGIRTPQIKPSITMRESTAQV